MHNRALTWRWQITDGHVRQVDLRDQLNGQQNGDTLALPEDNFQITLGDGTVLTSSDFRLEGKPEVRHLAPDVSSPRLARHDPGTALAVRYAAPAHHLTAEWRVVLRRNSTYLREELVLHATAAVLIHQIVLFDVRVAGAHTEGDVSGSPVVAGNVFLGYEQPLAQNTVVNGVVRCAYVRDAVLKPHEALQQSLVLGVVQRGQLRRDFLAYIERERAHPYRPFLQYNSWYDIHSYTEQQAVHSIQRIGDELTVKRGVRLASYLFDDGWDDHKTLWHFSSRLPHGFTPLEQAAHRYHSAIVVWISPFGGYGGAKRARLMYALAHGFETDGDMNSPQGGGFSLAGPKYYQRFHDICVQMIRNYGVNQFKFDGLAAGSRNGPDGLTRDRDAMLRLIGQLRALEPNLYINQTVGTWPSPFWLRYVDSTWRGGNDHSFYGAGDQRQRWITYRDMITYRNVVQRGPLYPLNSIMLHGIILGRYGKGLEHATDTDFADEVHEFFATGTQVEELYITPEWLDQNNWDVIAESAKWAQDNADVLVDTHWVGGDPGQGQVYGWASWSPRKAILTLRNPSAQQAVLTADPQKLWELPQGAQRTYVMHSPWKSAQDQPVVTLVAGQPHTFVLQPFQVLVLQSH